MNENASPEDNNLDSLLLSLALAGVSVWPEKGELRFRGPEDALGGRLFSELQKAKENLRAHFAGGAHPIPALERTERRTPTPLTLVQRRIKAWDAAVPRNCWAAYRWDGLLELEPLETSVREVLSRHGILFATFNGDETGPTFIEGMPEQSPLRVFGSLEGDIGAEINRFVLKPFVGGG